MEGAVAVLFIVTIIEMCSLRYMLRRLDAIEKRVDELKAVWK